MWDAVMRLSQEAYGDPEYVVEINRLADKYNLLADDVFEYPGGPDVCIAFFRDRTVSRRSEPSSRATLMGEQPNPWDLLQPQDVTNRHRDAEPPRRCELLGETSLLSPEYLLSYERWPFHSEPPDHYVLLSHLIDL